MLRITIELVPYGNEDLAREIGQVKIINDGSGDHKYGNYTYELSDDTNTITNPTSIKGTLKEHYRLQSVFRLLQAVLNKALGLK